MTGSDSQNIFNNSHYSRDSKKTTNKGFIKIKNSSMGRIHWTYFSIKIKKSFYFDPLGAIPDKLYFNKYQSQTSFSFIKFKKPIGIYVAYFAKKFFHVIEKMSYKTLF